MLVSLATTGFLLKQLLYTGAGPSWLGRRKAGSCASGSQLLTPLELLDRLATLVPSPRIHRHRYFGVLAPNAPLRPAVTALALAAATTPPAPPPQPSTAEPAHRRAARYAWALLLVRIYEVFPRVWPHCGGAMRIIAFITDGPTVRDIPAHLGERMLHQFEHALVHRHPAVPIQRLGSDGVQHGQRTCTV